VEGNDGAGVGAEWGGSLEGSGESGGEVMEVLKLTPSISLTDILAFLRRLERDSGRWGLGAVNEDGGGAMPDTRRAPEVRGLVVGTSHSLSAPSSAVGRSCIEMSASDSSGLGERGEVDADHFNGEDAPEPDAFHIAS
jgi:hypothetical protein